MSLGFDSISENPLSALTAEAGVSGVVTCGQGAQTADAVGAEAFNDHAESGQGSQAVDSIALLQFISTATSGQGSQTVDVSALLQFLAATTSGQGSQSVDAVGIYGVTIVGSAEAGQGSQTVDAVALLAFIASATSSQHQTIDATALLAFIASATNGQGSQTADALGASGNGIIAICTSGQGDQTADCAATATAGFALLDGVGVGRGNKSWWRNKEVVVDHRLRHKGHAKTGQTAQGAVATGGVRNPFALVAVASHQPAQATAMVGDVTDPELEEFAMLAAAMFDEEWREAA